jgi:uncharacterized protein YerC
MTRRREIETSENSVLAERQHEDGRRRIQLTQRERQALARRERAEAAAALFLDLEEGRTYQEIAAELGISVSSLKDLTKTAEFDEAYSALYVELGHDPRFQAAQSAIGNMLPVAVTQLKSLLVNPNTPAGTRYKVIEKIFALNGLNDPAPQASDRKELAEFLAERNINIENVGIFVPPDYLQSYEQIVEGQVIERTEEDTD